MHGIYMYFSMGPFGVVEQPFSVLKLIDIIAPFIFDSSPSQHAYVVQSAKAKGGDEIWISLHVE
jgi:hypothetical protein